MENLEQRGRKKWNLREKRKGKLMDIPIVFLIYLNEIFYPFTLNSIISFPIYRQEIFFSSLDNCLYRIDTKKKRKKKGEKERMTKIAGTKDKIYIKTEKKYHINMNKLNIQI